jgi:cysteine synthase
VPCFHARTSGGLACFTRTLSHPQDRRQHPADHRQHAAHPHQPPVRHGAEVWIKSERANPGGSIKDRIALAMVEDAEAAAR